MTLKWCWTQSNLELVKIKEKIREDSSCNHNKPSKSPGTSPLASNVFILSRNEESKMFDSSIMKAIFSFLHPDLLSTILRSSSKSSPVYFRWTWNDKLHNTNKKLWYLLCTLTYEYCLSSKSDKNDNAALFENSVRPSEYHHLKNIENSIAKLNAAWSS